jgi:hypothetical protein
VGDLVRPVDHQLVHLRRLGKERFRKRIGLGAFGRRLLGPWTRQLAASERRPRRDGHSLGDAQAKHFALVFPIEQVVVVLHRDEGGPAVRPLNAKGLHELPRMHGRCAEITGLAGANDVVERLECFLERCVVVVEAVDDVEIDVVGAKTPQALVDF